MKGSAGQPPPLSITELQSALERAMQLGRQVSSERECWAAQPPKIYKTFWIGQCSWAKRLLVKQSAEQGPPSKKLQGVLYRAMQLGRQVTSKIECWAPPHTHQKNEILRRSG